MIDHAQDFAKALEPTGLSLETVFYCAESVLLPEYRGLGIGHRFFDLREDHARRLGATVSAFCSVVRAPDHPMRPDTYRPLDAFWRKRGYRPVEGAVARFRWKDLGDDSETEKPLQVWMRTFEEDET
jgi:GNAT superfamily N-acetyltransferase